MKQNVPLVVTSDREKSEHPLRWLTWTAFAHV